MRGRPWLWVLLALVVVALIIVLFRAEDEAIEIPISAVIEDVRAGRVSRIEIRHNALDVLLIDGSSYQSRKEDGVSIYTILSERGVDSSGVTVAVKGGARAGHWLGLILNFLPLMIFFGLIGWLIREVKRRPTS